MEARCSHSLKSLLYQKVVKRSKSQALQVALRNRRRLSEQPQPLGSRIIVKLPDISCGSPQQFIVRDAAQQTAAGDWKEAESTAAPALVRAVSCIRMPAVGGRLPRFKNQFRPLPPMKDPRFATYELRKLMTAFSSKYSKLVF